MERSTTSNVGRWLQLAEQAVNIHLGQLHSAAVSIPSTPDVEKHLGRYGTIVLFCDSTFNLNTCLQPATLEKSNKQGDDTKARELRNLNLFFLSHAHTNYISLEYPKSLNGFMVWQMWRKVKEYIASGSGQNQPTPITNTILQTISFELIFFFLLLLLLFF